MPVHYDIEAAERTMREGAEKAKAEATAAVEAGKADREFVTTQHHFLGMQIELALCQMRAANSGSASISIAAVAGLTLGQMFYSLIQTYSGDHLAALVENFNGAVAGPSGHAIGEHEWTIGPMQGGNA